MTIIFRIVSESNHPLFSLEIFVGKEAVEAVVVVIIFFIIVYGAWAYYRRLKRRLEKGGKQ